MLSEAFGMGGPHHGAASIASLRGWIIALPKLKGLSLSLHDFESRSAKSACPRHVACSLLSFRAHGKH